ncbi:WD repeat-containing protein 3 [Anopheles ziemanni]|uniref:WD repeat-containing protein 3 n=1 Tax=Anopheles coustani TaxID=139045 RepID=UPI00265AF754|nr:WD repeat-containing protein 3 [Anopheles coustani]XP_058171238.1 WD repeat-containing protein 3 [Anopheles ziemanni]
MTQGKMGLTKQYLAYKPVSSFNIIASSRANISFISVNNVDGRYVVVAAAEKVIVWNMRIGEKVAEFTRDKQEVTFLRASPDHKHLAVGYSDGVVEMFSFESKQSVCSFAAHRSAVSALNFDLLGLKLASGGLDNDVVVSDVVAQTGKCRLTGHSAPITQVCFMQRYHDVIVTSSKDTQIKFWNVETHCCFKTIVDHRTEVWGIVLMRNDDFLVCGSADTQLSVYRIAPNTDESKPIQATEDQLLVEESTVSPFRCTAIGSIQRAGYGRTINLVADGNGQVLGCHGTDKQIELFYFAPVDEAVKKLTKRMKKLNAKKFNETETQPEVDVRQLSLTDEIKRLSPILTSDKVKSFDLLLGSRSELRICCTFLKNFIELFSLDMDVKKAEPVSLHSIHKQGHPSEARTVSFSSDNLAIASGSAESLKLWNRSSQTVLRTIDTSGYVVSTCFVPGDRHVLVGLKSGELLIVDIVAGEELERIEAHEKEVWSIVLTPDMHGCVTGGGDMTVKFWSFELIANPERPDLKVLSLLHKNTLKLEETVLCVRISSNGKYIAVALLDTTVKIFFLDSLKFYLSLYGHKLPVLTMDISYDSSLIVTGSADRTIKIWGMDFGDCHRSLLAHDNTVTALQFIPNTHMFFSCGKDGKLKQWDADNFQKIVTLPGHLGEAHALAISPNGKYVVSCGSDRTLRLFHRTDEPLVLQDVQEEEREELENATLATGEESAVPGLPGLQLPSKKTIGSEKGAENILECLEVSKQYEEEGAKGPLPPLMFAYSATNTDDFLLTVLSRIRASDLEESLLLLPFAAVCELLERIPKLTITRKDQTELICKVVLFLFRVHQKPIVSNQVLLPVIQKIIHTLQEAICELRDMIGMNFHASQMLQRELEENDGCVLFRDATKLRVQRDRRRKRREASKRILVNITK